MKSERFECRRSFSTSCFKLNSRSLARRFPFSLRMAYRNLPTRWMPGSIMCFCLLTSHNDWSKSIFHFNYETAVCEIKIRNASERAKLHFFFLHQARINLLNVRDKSCKVESFTTHRQTGESGGSRECDKKSVKDSTSRLSMNGKPGRSIKAARNQTQARH